MVGDVIEGLLDIVRRGESRKPPSGNVFHNGATAWRARNSVGWKNDDTRTTIPLPLYVIEIERTTIVKEIL